MIYRIRQKGRGRRILGTVEIHANRSVSAQRATGDSQGRWWKPCPHCGEPLPQFADDFIAAPFKDSEHFREYV